MCVCVAVLQGSSMFLLVCCETTVFLPTDPYARVPPPPKILLVTHFTMRATRQDHSCVTLVKNASPSSSSWSASQRWAAFNSLVSLARVKQRWRPAASEGAELWSLNSVGTVLQIGVAVDFFCHFLHIFLINLSFIWSFWKIQNCPRLLMCL